MSFSILRSGPRYEIRFDGEPDYFRSLQMSPSELEPELRVGCWLVLVFAVWSMPDREAIDVAMSAARSFGGSVILGVRPFDEPEEALSWCPKANVPTSPIWLVFRDSSVVGLTTGTRSVEEVVQLVRPHL